MSDAARFYSEAYVEVTREDGRLVAMDWETWQAAPAEQLVGLTQRLFARDARGEKVYLAGGIAELFAAQLAYRASMTLQPILHGRRAPRGQS